MRDHKDSIEVDFTDQIQQLEFDFMAADEKAGYPPNCNDGYVEKDGKCVKESTEASEKPEECDNESCGDCECEENNATEESTESQADHDDEAVEEHDIDCPSCGCALGRMWTKAGTMKPNRMYASKYSDLYRKVKAADPQHDVEKQPEIKTKFESQRKIEDMPNAVELRDVDEPIGNKD